MAMTGDGVWHQWTETPSTSSIDIEENQHLNALDNDFDENSTCPEGGESFEPKIKIVQLQGSRLLIWNGYVYRQEGVGKTDCHSWWHCQRNIRRTRESRSCLGRAVVKNGVVRVAEEHNHEPDTTENNYVPPHTMLMRQKSKHMEAAVRGFLSPTDQDLLQIGYTRGPKRHKCDVCEMTFAIARVLETHKMLEHKFHPPWKCSECGMQFLHGLSYNLHMARSHTVKPYSCDFEGCAATFGSKSDLTAHIANHQDNQEVTVGDEEGNLERLEKPVYKCHLCPAEYPHMCKLRYHMRMHTGERPFKCSECSSAFKTSSQRLNHVRRTHLRVRKHLCDLCGKKFKDPRTLKEHSWTHSGEKPYSCPVCSRAFGKRDAMLVHIRQHTGEKPYVCDQCGQSFTVRVSLRTHLKSKHNITVDTSSFRRREDDPGDNSIPAIGRPKRKDSEKQLSVKAKIKQEESELNILNSFSCSDGANSRNPTACQMSSLRNRNLDSGRRNQKTLSLSSITSSSPSQDLTSTSEKFLLEAESTVTLQKSDLCESELRSYSSGLDDLHEVQLL